jgi:hypothetical protein
MATIDPQNPGGGDTIDGGTMPPAGNIDPNGFQTTATAAGTLGFFALLGSGHGDTLSGALGLGSNSSPVVTAGLSWASFARVDLFTVGLILVALCILLNVASLVIRRQNHYAEVDACEKEIERRARRYAASLQRASTGGSQPLSTGSPNRPNG